MLVAVNIGNTLMSFGFFEDNDCRLLHSFKISSDVKKTSDEYAALINSIALTKNIDIKKVSSAVISSVVPQLTNKLKNTVSEFFGCVPIIVGPGVKTGFKINIDNPSELGADIVAHTAAAVHIKGKDRCAVIVDLGAVNTVSAIGKNGEYFGCAIFSGVQMDLDALHTETAQLPNVHFSASEKAIGKNSHDSICSGVLLGNALAIDGFAERFALEMKSNISQIDLIATGEYADIIISKSSHKFLIDKDLTLKGLYYIYKNNI